MVNEARREGDDNNRIVHRFKRRLDTESTTPNRRAGESHRVKRLLAKLAIEQSRVQELEGSVDRLARDKLIPGMYSEQGFREKLRTDPEMQAALREGNFGVIGIDARGVKALNDTSLKHGDELLLLLAERHLQTSLVRHGDPVTRRGDDFAVLVGRVTPEQQEEVKNRMTEGLSVEKAVHDAQRGAIPVIASVSWVHASEIPQPRDIDTYEGLVKWYETIENEAGIRNVGPKHDQYTEMWEMIGDPGERPGDERRIADAFFRKFCPHFVEQISLSMQQRELSK